MLPVLGRQLDGFAVKDFPVADFRPRSRKIFGFVVGRVQGGVFFDLPHAKFAKFAKF